MRPAVVADDDAGDNRRDDPRLMEPVGDQICAVRRRQGERELDEVVIGDRDRPGDEIADAEPDGRADDDRRGERHDDVRAAHAAGRPLDRDREDDQAVPSLNRLSLSMSVARRRGEPSCRKVGDDGDRDRSRRPSPRRRTRARAAGRSRAFRTTATIAALMRTPGDASRATPPRLLRRSSNSIRRAASNTRPGSRTSRTSSGRDLRTARRGRKSVGEQGRGRRGRRCTGSPAGGRSARRARRP